ncbi:MAG: DNA-directed RNA polymerase subunit F [Candidatus Nanohaloarchaea archaeon]|jgi:DNA-directed RNA polymerase subunit F
MEIKDEEYVYPVEALEALEDRDEEELVHEQKIALENLTRHTKVKDLDTLEELNDELSDIDSLKQKHVYKLLEVVPQHESTVRAVFSKERVKLDDSEVEEILEICQSIETE